MHLKNLIICTLIDNGKKRWSKTLKFTFYLIVRVSIANNYNHFIAEKCWSKETNSRKRKKIYI